jgi:hypothetical protein
MLTVLADTADKAQKAHALSIAQSGSGEPNMRLVFEQAGDCLVRAGSAGPLLGHTI